jgi:alpha-glucoside transport system substrate-binding protein
MKQTLLTGAATVALTAGMASAQDLTVFGPWLGPDQEMVETVLAAFEEQSGYDVSYVGSDSFEQQIDGFLTPLRDGTADWLRENYAAGQSWVDLGTFENASGEENLYGMFYKVDVKSLVWYVPENFEDAGYDIPETMKELKALTEQMAADGLTPWCIGLGSGGATGWPATDWVEDMMLRTQPPEVYDDWVTNEMPFDAEPVVNAIEEFGYFARNDDYVAGGSDAVASTDFRDSPKGLFDAPPQCMMHRQASFIPAFFPEGTEVGLDADFFYFPAYEAEDLGTPVLGAGTMWAITNENEAAHDLMAYLQTPEAHEIWMGLGGFLTPHTGVDTSTFADPTLAKMNDILLDATTFRFDASDLMPGGVGAGSFWTGMVDYAGGADAEDVASDIQDSWDSLK